MSPATARIFLVVGALSALLAVALGAFAAHGLRGRVPPETLSAFETGARYHMYHALALVGLGLSGARGLGGALGPVAGWLFLAGTVLFSGSLYALAVTGHRWFGAITPFGGFAFLLGWLAVAIAAFRAP
jgi:uncharacterized membrane protein YgdD (TMEM256/DUF423 family)